MDKRTDKKRADEKILEDKTYQDFNKKAPDSDEVKKTPDPDKNIDAGEEAEPKEGAGSKTLEQEDLNN